MSDDKISNIFIENWLKKYLTHLKISCKYANNFQNFSKTRGNFQKIKSHTYFFVQYMPTLFILWTKVRLAPTYKGLKETKKKKSIFFNFTNLLNHKEVIAYSVLSFREVLEDLGAI